MARFLFVSKEGAIPDLAATVKREGHEVRLCILDLAEQQVGDGFVEKVEDWRSQVEWADTIVFDDAKFGEDADKLRGAGHAVIGGTPYTDRLEMDREFAQDEMKLAGLDTLPRWNFKSFDDAVGFLTKYPRRVVVKPGGSAQSEKVLTFVGEAEDGRDVVNLLGKLKKGWADKITSLELQQYVKGVEVAVGGFFDGTRFVLPACVNFEHKRMFTGEIGPTTGEMGTVCFWNSGSRLVREGLLKMERKLTEAGYRGFFDINFIATSDRLWPLECTPRFGYPTINVQIEGIYSPWGNFLHGLARGDSVKLEPKLGFQVGVVVAVPPFPFVDPEAFLRYSDDAVVVFRGTTQGVHPCDVKLVDGDWLLTGTAGYAVVVTGAGETVEEAREEAYGRIRNLIIPNMFYRTDIGHRWRRDADLLFSWGYLHN